MSTPVDKLFKKALKMHNARDLKGAAGIYQKIIRSEPGHIDALYMLGTLKAEQADLVPALDLLLQAAALAPYSPMIQNNLGNVYMKSEQLDEAACCYQRALLQKPNMPESHFNLASIYMRQEKFSAAVQGFATAASLKPDFFQAHFSLGNLYRTLGDCLMAIRSFRNAVALAPNSSNALYGLANALAANHDWEEATVCFHQLLELNPADESAKFALAALRGETPTTAPHMHVKGIFNDLAGNFDSHLAQLDYRIPEILRDVMVNISGPNAHFSNCIDLGCGTGISGAAFRPYTKRISGVDLSGKMIAIARNKEIYDDLFEEGLIEHLKRNDDLFDLVLATDVFVYIGELSALFAEIKRRTMAGAHFLFSTERSDDADYVLQPSGRYAHSPAYIANLAAEFDFTIKHSNPVKIRMEKDVPLMGDIFVLSRNTPSS